MPVLSPTPTSDTGTDQTYPQFIETQYTQGLTSPEDNGRQGRRPRWKTIGWLVGACVVAAAGVGIYALSSGDDTAAAAATQPAQIRVVEAVQRDLVEFTNLDGTLQYADVSTATAAIDGAVTWISDDGDTLTRGETAFEINDVPVVIMYGDVPMYRGLAQGIEGSDVEMLEANLASLGYHLEEDIDGDLVDGGFTVDGVFDSATTDAVQRWQEDVGQTPDGSVGPADMVVVQGQVTVSSVQADVGTRVQANSPVLNLNLVSRVSAFYSEHGGSVELVATEGPVTSGMVLYEHDDLPITAIVTEEDVDRTLSEGVEAGDDIRVLEEMLAGLGYDADGDLDVDDEFDEATTEAVKDWAEDLQDEWDDVIVDGIVTLDEIIVVEPGVSIGQPSDFDDDEVVSGTELFTYGSASSGRVVSTAIEVADQTRLAEGNTVDVEFPDGSIVSGIVTDVATSSIKDPLDPDAEAMLPVKISLDTLPESVAALNELDVEVLLVDDLAEAATVVPSSALVATADGGFAVEVLNDDNTTTFVAVDPGMFADGFVEVAGISPGTIVVVPS